MKTLKESLFDDHIKSNLNIDVQTAFDIITQHISKKFRTKLLTPKEAYSKKYKEGKFFYYSADYHHRSMDGVRLCFLSHTAYNKAIEDVGIGISICIASNDISDEYKDIEGCYLGSIDIGWSVAGDSWVNPDWWTLWVDEEYKRFSNLKTTLINSDTLPDILKYIDWLCKKILDISKRDKDEIQAISRGEAWGAEDNPLMKGKKDKIWYINKLKKELVP